MTDEPAPAAGAESAAPTTSAATAPEAVNWIADPGPQAAVAQLNAGAEQLFGDDAKADPDATLREGLIGATVDHASHQVVYVVDAGRANLDTVRAELKNRARLAHERGATVLRDRSRRVDESTSSLRGDALTKAQAESQLEVTIAVPLLDVEVVAACHTADELLEVTQTLRARDWSASAGEASFTFAVDPATATVEVTFDPAATAAGDALTERFGDRVRVDYGGVARTSRTTDGEPHYGAAAIGAKGDRFCTSGFTVKRNGYYGQVTADHCFANGASVYSGTEYVGKTAGGSGYPTYDMMRIESATEDFDSRIYTDPRSTSRYISGYADPSVNSYLCASGYVTRAVCGIRVTSTSATLCDSDGCTPGVIRAEKPGATIVSKGDSGGPLYVESGSSAAVIRGMIIGMQGSSVLYGERVSSIQAHLGVSVTTY
ncbi:S1 family peptidase [Luedemannella helvata]|uniref:S1 family peptidase n=1 Tax=Luedemannella helvata TaxID=349315 RepID=A0ABN2KP92_9ACTN